MLNSHEICSLGCMHCEDRAACLSVSPSRREVLKLLTMAGAAGLLAGCAPSITQPPTSPASTDIPSPTLKPTDSPTATQEAAFSGPDYWPTDGWRTSTPEEQGLDSAKLAKLYKFVKENGYDDLHSLAIIRNGYLVTEVARYPYQVDKPHRLGDSFKAFLPALIGIAIAEGHLKSIDQPVIDLFSDYTIDNLDANKKAITIENLLKNQSGILWTVDDYTGARHSDDWVQYQCCPDKNTL